MRRSEVSLTALIELIDDPDSRVYDRVRNEILGLGLEAIPLLEDCMNDNSVSPSGFERIEAIKREIHFSALKFDLHRWIHSADKDLLEGAYLISRYQYPDLELTNFRYQVWEIRKDIWLEINQRQTAFETIKVFNKIFFYFHEFRKVKDNEITPFDLFLQSVIETGEGDSFALGLLYSILAQSLDLPVFKIIQPNGNSVLAFMDEYQTLSHLNLMKECHGILFYINTENHGAIIDSISLQEKLSKLGIKSRRAFLEPSSNTTIIKTYIKRIIDSCRTNQHLTKAKDLQELLCLFDTPQESETE
jgi:regulator of sirC expression with transglutaminase-like and TPR domain